MDNLNLYICIYYKNKMADNYFTFATLACSMSGTNDVDDRAIEAQGTHTENAALDLHVKITQATFNALFSFTESTDSWAFKKSAQYNVGGDVSSVTSASVAVVNSVSALLNTDRTALVDAVSTAAGNLAEVLLADEHDIPNVTAANLKTILGGVLATIGSGSAETTLSASSLDMTVDDDKLTKQIRGMMNDEAGASSRTELNPFVANDLIYYAEGFTCEFDETFNLDAIDTAGDNTLDTVTVGGDVRSTIKKDLTDLNANTGSISGAIIIEIIA